jgi:hypothetical protein
MHEMQRLGTFCWQLHCREGHLQNLQQEPLHNILQIYQHGLLCYLQEQLSPQLGQELP